MQAKRLANPPEPLNQNIDDIEVLKAIANGVNPFTGEIITGIDDELKNRLTSIIIELLSFSAVSNKNGQNSSDRSMVGKSWTTEEDALLVMEFKKGLSISKIANIHKRNPYGIRVRLKKHGLID